MEKICGYISHIPATQEPFSADVFVVEGKKRCYIFDVGCTEGHLRAIRSITREKIFILSHFHRDHTANIHKLEGERVYVGDLTRQKIGVGTVITEPITIADGVRLTVRPVPSPHVGGSLIVTVNDEYALLADLYFTRPDYDRTLGLAMMEVLEELNVRYFVVSHEEGGGVHEKSEIMPVLRAYFYKDASKAAAD